MVVRYLSKISHTKYLFENVLFSDLDLDILVVTILNLREIKDHSLINNIFSKTFPATQVLDVCTLHKKGIFCRISKVFFLWDLNHSGSLAFGNASLGEIKCHSLITTHFQNVFWDRSFRYVSTLRKEVFSVATSEVFFLTQILLFSRIPV